MYSLMKRKGGAGGGEGRMEEGRGGERGKGGERGGKGGREGERGREGGRGGERGKERRGLWRKGEGVRMGTRKRKRLF